MNITVGCICSFLFGNLKIYSYLCKKITYTPCYKLVKIKIYESIYEKVDSIAPNPWYVDGVKQARPTTQLGFMIGVVVGITLCYFLF